MIKLLLPAPIIALVLLLGAPFQPREATELESTLTPADAPVAVETAAPTVTPEAEETAAVVEAEPTEAETEVEEPEVVPTVDTSKTPHAEQCLSETCAALTASYGFEGIYGYYSDRRVEQLQEALDAYAVLLGAGDILLGQAEFRARVSGENGFQRIEFVEALRSGRVGPAYARFAPEVAPEIGGQEADTYAIWCGADQMLGPCAAYAILPGTILVDVSTDQHRDELTRTIAHELTHALDSKSGYDARAQFEASGAATAGPETGGSLQEQFAETVAQWLFPRSGDPAADWDPLVGAYIQNYFGAGV